MYENTDICKKCGGKCCKRMPGANFPSDFPNLEIDLTEALQSRRYAIDWWEGDEPEYFIRPATKDTFKLFDPSWGGECVFLKDTCTLTPEKRPHNCRMLEPKETKCINHDNSKRGAVDAWKPYQSTILKIAKTIEQKTQ